MFRSSQFALSDTAVEQMRVIRADYLAYSPQNPPVLAGISVAASLVEGKAGQWHVVIGFWRQSEITRDNPEWKNAVRVRDIDVVFDVPEEHLPMFAGKVIDYAPDRAFFLKPIPPSDDSAS